MAYPYINKIFNFEIFAKIIFKLNIHFIYKIANIGKSIKYGKIILLIVFPYIERI